MAPRLRTLLLLVHVVSSVGWLGAAAAYLVLGVFTLVNHDAQLVRAAILAMEPMVLFVLVPLGSASLLTGVVQSLGTTWGLLRHYWVLGKFLLTCFAVFLLLEYARSLAGLAGIAAHEVLTRADLLRLQDSDHVARPVGGMAALGVAVTLSVYKPRRMTRYGRRRQHDQRLARRRATAG